jgi:hypothetical protein
MMFQISISMELYYHRVSSYQYAIQNKCIHGKARSKRHANTQRNRLAGVGRCQGSKTDVFLRGSIKIAGAVSSGTGTSGQPP